MTTARSSSQPKAKKHFSSSILLWMRTDQPRHTGMDHWKGPHSAIIAATPGVEEYRQIHLAEDNAGLWPAIDGVETRIPADWKIDGIAEVTLKSPLSPLLGRKQTALAFKDEVNVFRRTLLYAGLPGSSRWHDVTAPGESVGSRAVLYLRRRDEVTARKFHAFVDKTLVSALAGTGVLRELRTQTFLPWNEKLWDTPNVAHDNPSDQRFHASIILGFADTADRDAFITGTEVKSLSSQLASMASAIHAYDVAAALTYVKHGHVLPHFEE